MILAHNRDMVCRTAWLAIIVLSGLTLMGCPKAESGVKNAPNESTSTPVKADKRPKGVVGYYKLDDPAQYGAKSMNEVPVGQVRYLGIEKGRWMLRDMLVGFGGPWAETTSGAIFTVTEGPSGPVKEKETIEVERIRTGLTLKMPKGKAPDLTFTYVDESAPVGFGYDEFFGSKK